jgi:hypothetical protein
VAKTKSNGGDKVMALVEQELAKNADATVDDLFEKARAVDKSVGKLTKRQFHARYPLQVKRREGGKSKSRRRLTVRKKARAAKPSEMSANREAVRTTLMAFASDMASAEQRKDLVQFLAGIDKYVDAVLKAASK